MTLAICADQKFLEGFFAAAKNTGVRVVFAADNFSEFLEKAPPLSPRGALVPSALAEKVPEAVRAFREAKVFVAGKVRKSVADSWDAYTEARVFVIPGEPHKAALAVEKILGVAFQVGSVEQLKGEGRGVAFWRRFKKGGEKEHVSAAGENMKLFRAVPYSAVPSYDATQPVENAGGRFRQAGGERVLDRPSPVLLLVGKRAESLAGRAKERGFVPITPNSRPGVQPDAAVVDAELAASAGSLGCRTIILSAGKFSDLLLASGDTLVALNGEAALDFAEKACRPGVAEGVFSPQDIYAGARPDAAAFRQYPKQEAPVKRPDDGFRGPAKAPKRGLVLAFYSGTQAQQGKTSLAVNSAALLAGRKMSVCLVDLDTSKAGLTRLLGYSESNQPGCDLESFFAGAPPADGPAGTRFVAVPLPEREWFLDAGQVEGLISGLAGVFDAVILDFGVRLVTPPVKAAFRFCGRIFVVTLPHRMSASAVARLRGQWLADVGSSRVAVVVNRVGYPSANLSPRDAARLLGFGAHYEVPEDPAVAAAEDEAARGRPYSPPVLGKKSRLAKALAVMLDGVAASKGGMRFVE